MTILQSHLFDYQEADALFLASRKFAGCFSGMGTGKTLTALRAVQLVDAARVLIVAPPIALTMWKGQYTAWLSVNSEPHIIQTGKEPLPSTSVLICSYQIATTRAAELRSWLAAASTSALICDESHALKSTKAKRTKAILGSGGICSGATHTWLLTGTPMTRWNDDLIPFLFRAAPAEMKAKCGGLNIERFKLRYTVQQKRTFPGARFPTKMTVGNRNTLELRDILYGGNGCAVRRELAEVWDKMPPLTHNYYPVGMTWAAEHAETKRMFNMKPSKLDATLRGGEIPLSTVRRQLGEAKVKAAADVIADRVDSGQTPVLVGAWHTSVIDGLHAALHHYKVRKLDGRTSKADRATIEEEFNAGEIDVLIGQIGAMGVSLNLQRGGNLIITVEEDWSPAIMEQFYARLHRLGQEKHVHVDHLICPDSTLETALRRIAGRKSSEATRLNDAELAR